MYLSELVGTVQIKIILFLQTRMLAKYFSLVPQEPAKQRLGCCDLAERQPLNLLLQDSWKTQTQNFCKSKFGFPFPTLQCSFLRYGCPLCHVPYSKLTHLSSFLLIDTDSGLLSVCMYIQQAWRATAFGAYGYQNFTKSGFM